MSWDAQTQVDAGLPPSLGKNQLLGAEFLHCCSNPQDLRMRAQLEMGSLRIRSVKVRSLRSKVAPDPVGLVYL